MFYVHSLPKWFWSQFFYYRVVEIKWINMVQIIDTSTEWDSELDIGVCPSWVNNGQWLQDVFIVSWVGISAKVNQLSCDLRNNRRLQNKIPSLSEVLNIYPSACTNVIMVQYPEVVSDLLYSVCSIRSSRDSVPCLRESNHLGE